MYRDSGQEIKHKIPQMNRPKILIYEYLSITYCLSKHPVSLGNLVYRYRQQYGKDIPSIHHLIAQLQLQHRCVSHKIIEVCGHRWPQMFFGLPLRDRRCLTKKYKVKNISLINYSKKVICQHMWKKFFVKIVWIKFSTQKSYLYRVFHYIH